MLKRALFAAAALVIGATYMQGAVTPALAGQIKVKPKISVKPKPRIRVVRPKVRIKIDPNRLARDKQEKKKKDATPRLAQPSGAPAGYDNASMPAGDVPVPGTDNIDAPNTPALDVPDGLRDLFEVTGGNLNDLRHIKDLDEFRGPRAMDALFGGGIPDPTLDGSGMGRRRGGAELDGPPRAGGQVSDPGYSASRGTTPWVQTDTSKGCCASGGGTSRTYTRTTASGATQTFMVERYNDGTVITTQSTDGGDDNASDSTETYSTPADNKGQRQVTVTTSSSHGENETTSTTTTTTDSARTPMDQDGDAEPDGSGNGGNGTASGGTASGSKKAGGGDQGGDWTDPNYSTPRGVIWTPLIGTIDRRVSPSDMTSQPPPSDVQGTVMVSGGSARPNVGAEAVTNTGGGDFIAGEGRGGGGSMIDPCATVSGCGGPGGGSGPGPAGPPSSN